MATYNETEWISYEEAFDFVAKRTEHASSLWIDELLNNAVQTGAVEIIGVSCWERLGVVSRKISVDEISKCRPIGWKGSTGHLWQKPDREFLSMADIANGLKDEHLVFSGLKFNGGALERYLDKYHPSPSLPVSTAKAIRDCEAWLKALPEEKIQTKNDTWVQAKEQSFYSATPTPNLSYRAFERIWSRAAPESWKRPGPKSGVADRKKAIIQSK